MKKTFVVIILILILLTGCTHKQKESASESSSRIINSMDTVMQITAYGEHREEALDMASLEINRLDLLLGTENPKSEVYQLNHSGTTSLSVDSLYLLNRSIDLYQKSNGIFDITVYPLIQKWGFTSKKYYVPSAEEISELLSYVDCARISVDQNSGIVSLGDGQSVDFGGIAKGYTSQRVIDIFRENNIESGIVSLGGNVHCLGFKPDGSKWKIGIQDPFNNSEICAVLSVADQAVITSGGYERFFTDVKTGKTYKHIIDPRTGYPAESGLSSVSIITSDGTLGDGLSTSLFIMGLDDAIDFWKQNCTEFQAVFVDDHGRIYATEGLRGSIESNNPISFIENEKAASN